MASIAKRPDGQWQARYQAPDGKWRARHFARKIDAKKWLDEQTAGIVTGTYVDPGPAKSHSGSTQRSGDSLRFTDRRHGNRSRAHCGARCTRYLGTVHSSRSCRQTSRCGFGG